MATSTTASSTAPLTTRTPRLPNSHRLVVDIRTLPPLIMPQRWSHVEVYIKSRHLPQQPRVTVIVFTLRIKTHRIKTQVVGAGPAPAVLVHRRLGVNRRGQARVLLLWF